MRKVFLVLAVFLALIMPLEMAAAADFLYPEIAVADGGTYGTATIGRKSGVFWLKYLKVVPNTYTTGTLVLQILTEAGSVFYQSSTISSGTATELITDTDTYPAKPIKSNWTIKMLHNAAVTGNKVHQVYYLLE